jgi:hypothetical protein
MVAIKRTTNSTLPRKKPRPLNVREQPGKKRDTREGLRLLDDVSRGKVQRVVESGEKLGHGVSRAPPGANPSPLSEHESFE